MYYYLKYYVGGFVDSYIQEKFYFESIYKENDFLVKFKAKKYSHISGTAINLSACTGEEYEKLLAVCIEYRLPYIMGYLYSI